MAGETWNSIMAPAIEQIKKTPRPNRNWAPIATIPDRLKDGRPVFMLPHGSDDPVVAAWRRGDWVPVSDGSQVIQSQTDMSGTTYADLYPEYWCAVPTEIEQ